MWQSASEFFRVWQSSSECEKYLNITRMNHTQTKYFQQNFSVFTAILNRKEQFFTVFSLDFTRKILYNSFMTTIKGYTTVRYTIYAALSLTTAVLVSGCAGGPYIGFEVYTLDSTYQRDCVGVNARYRTTDRECQQRHEPHTQTGQVQRQIPYSQLPQWQRDIQDRKHCRATGVNCPQGLK